MPELPEVEVLVRHLRPLLQHRTITAVTVGRSKVLQPTTVPQLRRALVGACFTGLTRRGKYLVFSLASGHASAPLQLLGHLGMTGRMYFLRRDAPRPKHLAVELGLGSESLIFEDTRYFGRLTLDTSPLEELGPEPLGEAFTSEYLFQALQRSAQAIKIRLLDQSLVAGVGNIYASESLFRAGISPRLAARRLSRAQVRCLRQNLRRVLADAIAWGSTVPLSWAGNGRGDRLFYYGRELGGSDFREEKLRVYDRDGKACCRCGALIKRIVQAARSTFYCPACQRN
jgi:formamidopyrimidine-DNA glycosylase